MRFSSSNGLGDVSTALWSVILSNPEKSGLAAILGGEGGDPEGREPLGKAHPCRMWESCDLFLPGLGCHWPRLRGGGGNVFLIGFGFHHCFLSYSILMAHVGFSDCMAMEPHRGSLISLTRRPHAFRKKWLRPTLGFLEVPLGFSGCQIAAVLPCRSVVQPFQLAPRCGVAPHLFFILPVPAVYRDLLVGG